MKFKPLLKFIIIIIISGIFGGVVSAWANHWDLASLETAKTALLSASPYIMIVCAAVLCLAAWYFNSAARRLYARQGNDDEFIAEKIDGQLNIALICTGVCFAVLYLFFGLTAAGMRYLDLRTVIIATVAFLVFALLVVFLQSQIVKFLQTLYPEKRGNVLELRFQKEWLASCDEAERHIMYAAAYKTLRVMQIALIACWLVSVIGALHFGAGILAIIITSLLWGLQTLVCSIAAMKLEKAPLR